MSSHSLSTAGVQGGGRITGLDAARALAIFGMLWAHVGPMDFHGPLGRLYALPHGRASLLFAVLAGISLKIIYSRCGADQRVFFAKILWRSGWLVVGGLALQLLNHGIAVILSYYGLIFLLCAFFVRRSAASILLWSVVFMLLGGAAFLIGTLAYPELFDRATVDFFTPPGQALLNLFATGAYPAMVWISPVLFGLWLGQQNLACPQVARRLIKWGGAVFVLTLLLSAGLEILLNYPLNAGLFRLIYIDAHSQLPLWLINGVALASFIIGVCLSLTRLAPTLTMPLQLAGKMALTLYVAQLLAFAVAGTSLRADSLLEGSIHSLALIALSLILSWVILSRFRRGPLEWLLALLPVSTGAQRQPAN